MPSIEFAQSRHIDLDEEQENEITENNNNTFFEDDDDQLLFEKNNKDSTKIKIINTNKIIEEGNANKQQIIPKSLLRERYDLFKKLYPFMIPLFLVYFAEYLINQGLYELLYFKNSIIKQHKAQYRYILIL